jgi:TRAP-type C4-dicarboxylate transport system permease small subunit
MDAHAATLPPPAAPATGFGRLADRLDRAVGTVVELTAAVLVLAEIIILGAGVTARYAFHAPLVWSDELASILFLWLSMLGAVVALAPRRAYAHDRARHAASARRRASCSRRSRSPRRSPSW